MSLTPQVNCRHCQHFYVTWEPRTPYGCKLMGFKGQMMPSFHVFRNSGQECQMFTPKSRPPK